MPDEEGFRIVGVDTTVLIWGWRKEGTAEELDRARWLLEKFEADKSQIVVSTPVLAEYLTPSPQREHAGIIAGLNTRFFLTTFDIVAASLAAGLFKTALETADRTYDNWRQVLRADCAIVAAAKANRVQAFYSNDAQCRKLAKALGMVEFGLPEVANSLYDESLKRKPR